MHISEYIPEPVPNPHKATSPTLTPKYSYLASLDDWAVGLRRQQETALYVRANTDHDMEGPSPVALEPLPAAALERSLNPAGSNEAAAAPGGLLPEDLYAILKDRPYDPFWMEANGISGHIHPGNPSKVKLEKLFYDGCLLVGDKFRIRLVAHNGGAFIAEATVSLLLHLGRKRVELTVFARSFRLALVLAP